MEYYYNISRIDGRVKIYKQDGSMVALAIVDTEKEAKQYIKELKQADAEQNKKHDAMLEAQKASEKAGHWAIIR
jgi:lipid II:glycine glycyltransferase (peptidoglycan interpeptide bridge formation enzyme)